MSAPAFQFFARDFEMATAALSNAEVGAHIRLLCCSWNNGPLPADANDLARIMRASSKREAAALWARVQRLWTATDAGYVLPGLEAQRERQAAYRAKQAANGRESGRARAAARVDNPPSPGETSPHEPDTNDRSTTVRTIVEQPHEPDANQTSTLHSSIFDLRSADQDRQKDQERTRAPKPRARRQTVIPAGFPEFWRAYPRHEKRAKAESAWQKLEPDADLQARILSALDWQRQQPLWHEDRGKYIPHAATWLNDRRWEDEPFDPVSADDDNQLERVTSGKGRIQ